MILVVTGSGTGSGNSAAFAAAASIPAVANRSPGSLAIPRATTWSKARGTLARILDADGGGETCRRNNAAVGHGEGAEALAG